MTEASQRARKARKAQKRGDEGEAAIVKTFEPLVGLRNIRSRKRLEAGDVATGADSEIEDPEGRFHLIIQRKNRKHTNVPAAWREIVGADGKRADQIPVVWASWRGVEIGRRVLHLAILESGDAEHILMAAGDSWIGAAFRQTFRGKAIPVAGRFIEHRAHASKLGYSIPILILMYPSTPHILSAIAWETFVKAWDKGRQEEEA